METQFAEVPNVVRALGAHLVGLMRRELKLILGVGAVMREWPLFPASLEESGVLANHW